MCNTTDKKIAAHHQSWLSDHPSASYEWLREKLSDGLSDGFHVHHVDHDRTNNHPGNLLLIYGPDHTRLHRIERQAALALQSA